MNIDVGLIVKINKKICEVYSNIHNILDKNLLSSIPNQVNQSSFGEELYKNIEEKISYIFSSILKNHIFQDANKRTASILYFYLTDKHKLKQKNDNEIYHICLDIISKPFNVKDTTKKLFESSI